MGALHWRERFFPDGQDLSCFFLKAAAQNLFQALFIPPIGWYNIISSVLKGGGPVRKRVGGGCLAAVLSAVLLCACGAAASAPAQATAAPPREAQQSALGVEQMLSELTLEQKVGQLFLVRPDALDLSVEPRQMDDPDAPGATCVTDAMRGTLTRYPVGGIVMFGKNIERPQQVRSMLADLQSASAIPLFTAVDEEGGRVARLANNENFDLPKYESSSAVGAGRDVSAAREMGRTIGTYLNEYGFNLDFAPVADLNTNPDNPVIGTRAFGSDPETVAELVGGACEGFAQAGVACTLKHFPGHGDTSEDTHNGAVSTGKTLDELKACELIPFARNLDHAPLIMAAHIAAPEVTGDDMPASLSRQMLTGLLREEMGYTGLIVTDSLSMGAITSRYSSGQAAIRALQAGADLLLMPASLEEAYEAVLEAVKDGTIAESRLDESVRRILECKERYNVITFG